MGKSDIQRPEVAEHKWKRILAAVKSLHSSIAEGCHAVPTAAIEETVESPECSLLQWMESLMQYSQGLVVSQDYNPPGAASTSTNNSTSTITAGVGVSTSNSSSSQEEQKFHPLLINQELRSKANIESALSGHVASTITSTSSINVDLGNYWESWEEQVLLHFTPDRPHSFSGPSFHLSEETKHQFLQDYYLNNERRYSYPLKKQWRGFNLETIYQIHDYEQQISCLRRWTREFQIAWSRKEYALVHSILVRVVALVSKSITPKSKPTEHSQPVGVPFNKVTTDCQVLRRWYPVTFVYVVRLLDDFRLKIGQRIQSFSSQGGDNEAVSKHATYPPSYQNNLNVCSLHCDGSEFRVDFIAKNTENDNKNCVTGSSTIVFHEWLSKTRSIYHIVPRLYLEVSLIQSYFFIISSIDTSNKSIHHSTSQYQGRTMSIHQLSSMLNGIGDPIVMIYLQCYIIHTLSSIIHSGKKSSTEASCVTNDEMLSLIMDFLIDFFCAVQPQEQVQKNNSEEASARLCQVKATLHLCFPAISFLFKILSVIALPSMSFPKQPDIFLI